MLVTRPAVDAERTASLLAGAGHEAVVVPLFDTRPLPHDIPDGDFDAVLVTSANAVRNLAADAASKLHHRPCLTVGRQTAGTARALGFSDITAAEGDVTALAALVGRKWPDGGRFLWLCGEDRRPIPLQRATVLPVVTYRAEAIGAMPQSLVLSIKARQLDAAMHFSPRAAHVFAELAEKSRVLAEAGHLLNVCISPRAVDLRLSRHVIARQPTTEAMIEALSGS